MTTRPSTPRVTYVHLPVATVSEANRHEHWRGRHKRASEQRSVAAWHTLAALRVASPRALALPLRVTIVRVSSGTLDGDNLQGANKSVRDGIADALMRIHPDLRHDADPRVDWRYEQRRCPRGERGATVVEVSTVDPAPTSAGEPPSKISSKRAKGVSSKSVPPPAMGGDASEPAARRPERAKSPRKPRVRKGYTPPTPPPKGCALHAKYGKNPWFAGGLDTPHEDERRRTARPTHDDDGGSP